MRMAGLIWAGAGLTVLGVIALLACVVLAVRMRKAGLPEAEMRTSLQKVVALNLGALAVSGLGLMLVIVGVILD